MDIDLGQSFVILNNLSEAAERGFDEDKIMETFNNMESDENSGQFVFQTALEIRKLSKVDSTGEISEEFSDEISSLIEENGELEISDLKKLSSSYRKEAREKEREERKMSNSHKFKNNNKNNDDDNNLQINNGNRGNSSDKGKGKDKANKSNGKAKGKNK